VASQWPWTSLVTENWQLIKGRAATAELIISFAQFLHYTLHEKFLNPLNLRLSLLAKFVDKGQINEQQCMEYF